MSNETAEATLAELLKEFGDELVYHPITGDRDFSQDSLASRFRTLIAMARTEGFQSGYRTAVKQADVDDLDAHLSMGQIRELEQIGMDADNINLDDYTGECDVCHKRYIPAAIDHCPEDGTCWEHCPHGHTQEKYVEHLVAGTLDEYLKEARS